MSKRIILIYRTTSDRIILFEKMLKNAGLQFGFETLSGFDMFVFNTVEDRILAMLVLHEYSKYIITENKFKNLFKNL